MLNKKMPASTMEEDIDTTQKWFWIAVIIPALLTFVGIVAEGYLCHGCFNKFTEASAPIVDFGVYLSGLPIIILKKGKVIPKLKYILGYLLAAPVSMLLAAVAGIVFGVHFGILGE